MQNNTRFHSMIAACLLAALVIGFGAATAGCKKKPPEASASAKRYDLKGKVVSASLSDHKVTIEHQEISGYMQAMTMPFSLFDDWVYSELKPGTQIEATLVVDGSKSWLENPVITEVVDPALAAKSTETGIEPSPGAAVPEFSLINQDGRKVSLKEYHGSLLVLTFIYTRCPLPDYCPLMSENFNKIRAEVASNPALKSRVRLLSITIDPEYDKPQVLREYGLRYAGAEKAALFNDWQFATGSPDQIKAVAQFFGLNYWPEKDQVIHGLRTAVITPDGKVSKVFRGNEWKPAEVMEQLGRAAK